MGKKVFAKKKTIMTHAKPNGTARVESRKEEKKLIEIKYIESP
jgi:hypothetical protein